MTTGQGPSIEVIGLSTCVCNSLKQAGIGTVLQPVLAKIRIRLTTSRPESRTPK